MDRSTAWSPRYHSQGSPRGVVSVLVDAPSSVLTIKDEHVVGRGTSVTCGGVTVTSINVPDAQRPPPEGKSCKYYEGCNGEVAVKCETPVADDDSASDAEISSIDFSNVEMRMKRARGPGDGGEGPLLQERERPMSWEGELLSDSEMPGRDDERMDVQPTDGMTSVVQCPRLRQDVTHGPSQELPHLADKVLGVYGTPSHSPVLPRGVVLTKLQQQHLANLPPNPSPDSAIHSAYYSSPAASPATSRHLPSSGFSSPFTPSLSRNNSDASQYGGSQNSSCYSYSSSPTHSPVQSRHLMGIHSMPGVHERERDEDCLEDKLSSLAADLAQHAAPGISRQQLINSPCPICSDKISGFHYGIFSCESCKGFFKRTVQNRKNYVCLRGSQCPVAIATRKKCPACRFDKCLKMGMKLEAIREDRTRGGRSTYQCSYSVPANLLQDRNALSAEAMVKVESPETPGPTPGVPIPPLLQEIMDVEHLWHYNERDMGVEGGSPSSTPSSPSNGGGAQDANSNLMSMCNIADDRLYKIVKWCKSLPLFKNMKIDDQICLLINSWCELLLFSCCFRSMTSPGEIRISFGKSISLQMARDLGLGPCIERMLNLTQHLRRLRLDKYEYVAMKVIVLLTSDVNGLREPEKVRASQEKALQALQHYTLHHYPETPSKFGELLLRIPELQRTCQVGKEMLSTKDKEGEDGPSFNLLMELLRGDH